jgi:HEAT repeat protein
VEEVNNQLLAHNVSRLQLPPGLDLDDIVRLGRTLAAYPGLYASWEELVGSLGPTGKRVTLTHAGAAIPVIRYDDQDGGAALSSRRRTGLGDEGGLVVSPLPITDFSSPSHPERVGPRGASKEDPKILEDLIRRGRSADAAGDFAALLDTASDFLRASAEATTEAAAKMYRLELKRMLSRNHLTQFARLATVANHRDRAVEVLSQVGSDATEVLMELLVEAETLSERRGYYSALTRIPDGTVVIIHHLEHPAWYVVRNAAELCGEMSLAAAVPALAQQVTHADERVRKSVAVALSRIGTKEALEPLSRLLKDPSPAIRVQVLGNLDGTRTRALAMPLAALLETEDHSDVLREILRALGRIGTPDALLALRRVAQGEIRRLGKRPRTQAIESLATAGAAATQILRTFAQDSDPDIAGAARRALEAGVPG